MLIVILVMSYITGKIKTATKKEIEYDLKKKITDLKTPIIRVKDDKKIAIAFVDKIDAKKIYLKEDLPFIPSKKGTFDIGSSEEKGKESKKTLNINKVSVKGLEITVKKDSTKKIIKLVDNAKKVNNVYKGYWIVYNQKIRKVVDYKNNQLTLDAELGEIPKENDKIGLYQHIFNDYISMGIDFTDFLGMDFSSLIDSLGGVFNFQMSSSLSSCCCLIVIILLFFMIKKKKGKKGKGLFIPGIGQMGSQQPLIIQMPMQTKPYPYNNSPFPRDT
jgi:hypothetical protein